MFKVDVEVADICYVLLFLSANGGCAGATERRELHISFALCSWLVPLCNLTTPHLCQFLWFICTLVGI